MAKLPRSPGDPDAADDAGPAEIAPGKPVQLGTGTSTGTGAGTGAGPLAPGGALPRSTAQLAPVRGASAGAALDLQVHAPEYISKAVDEFRQALDRGRADAAEVAWATVTTADRIAFGKSPTIDRDLQTIMRVLGPMLVPIMGECKLDFVGRADLIEQILRVGHPNWFDPISDYGGALLSSFIDHLPPRGTIDQTALAKLQRLMKGTTSLALARPLFERIYATTLSDTTYDAKKVQTAPWKTEYIHRLYDVLCAHLPLAHVRTITAFYIGKDIDHAWWTPDSRVVLPETDATTTDNRKHKMTGGARAQADPETGKGETEGDADKFDVGSLHEVGHGVGGRLGGHAWAESYAWVGWQTRLEVDAWSRGLWGDDAALTQRTRDRAGKHPVLTSTDARHYLAEVLHKTPKVPAGFKDSDEVEEAIDRYYGDQKLTKYWHAQEGKDVDQAYLFSGHDNYGNDGNVYVYLSRNNRHFSTYKQQAHEQKVSWYSLSSPHEWFAEQYAHYYRLKRTGAGLEPGTKAKLDELDQAKPTNDALMNPLDEAAGDGDGAGSPARRVPFPW